jgi:hypothetical protein
MARTTAPTRSDSNFHQYDPLYAENSIKKGLKTNRLVQRDADLILEFIADSQSCNNLGFSRIHKLTYTLVGWRRYIGPFAETTNADINRAMITLRSAKNSRGRPFAKILFVTM